MYQDWKQWARAVFAIGILWLVGELTQPWAIASYANFETPGWIQVTLLVLSAGMIFPKAKRFGTNEHNDSMQYGVGLLTFAVALAYTYAP